MLLTTFWVLCLTASTYAGISPNFPAQLLVKAAKSSTEDNVIVSPYSLLGPLGAFSVGTGYSTRGEILDILGLDEKANVFAVYNEYKKQLGKLGIQFSTANKLFISLHEKVNHRFNSQAKQNFNLQIEYIDFNQTEKADKAINDWVQNHTKQHVYWDLQTKPQLKALLVNAASLDAPWGKKFHKANKEVFHINKKDIMDAYYINSYGYFNYTRSKELQADVVSLPLKEETCQVLLVVPDFPTPVESILKALDVDGNIMSKIIHDLQISFLNLTIPSFKVGTTTDLKNVLKKMGVKKAFDDDEAQIRRMLRNNSELFLDEAKQNVDLSIFKGGVEADASNGVNVSPQSSDVLLSPPPQLYVNSPFYIEVRCSDIILFNGIIKKPYNCFQNDGRLGQCCGGR